MFEDIEVKFVKISLIRNAQKLTTRLERLKCVGFELKRLHKLDMMSGNGIGK